MKLRCFTSLIATVVMASAAGSVEVYNNKGNTFSIFGNLSGGQYFSKNSMNNGSHSFIRYGFISRSEISDKIFGFSTWENELVLQNVESAISLKDSVTALLGYVGIKLGDFGSIDYGRNYGVLYNVSSWADIIPEFGSDLSIPDNYLSNRASNVVTYRNNNCFGLLNGLDFAIQYQIKNDINQYTGRTVKTANGEGYGLYASYTLGHGIATSAAFTNSKRSVEQKILDGEDVSNNNNAVAYSVGLKYDAHGMYVAATYGETYNMTPFGDFDDVINSESVYGFLNAVKNVGVIAKYKFDFGFVPSISYVHSKANDMENNGYSNYLKKCITIGTGYLFNKNVSANIDYRLNLLNKNDFTTSSKICTDDLFAFGVSYIF